LLIKSFCLTHIKGNTEPYKISSGFYQRRFTETNQLEIEDGIKAISNISLGYTVEVALNDCCQGI
jgi:hypothetical protein